MCSDKVKTKNYSKIVIYLLFFFLLYWPSRPFAAFINPFHTSRSVAISVLAFLSIIRTSVLNLSAEVFSGLFVNYLTMLDIIYLKQYSTVIRKKHWIFHVYFIFMLSIRKLSIFISTGTLCY
jgi:hypothetical protein